MGPVRREDQAWTMPKAMQAVKGVVDKTDEVMGGVKGIVNTLDAFVTKVPGGLKQAVGTMSFFGAVSGAFAVPSLASNVSKAVYANNAVDRVKSVVRATLDANAMWNGFTSVVWALKTVRAMAADAFSWVATVSKVLFPLQALDFGLDAHETYTQRQKRDTLLANIKVEDLTKSAEYIRDNYSDVRKALVITKKAEIDKKAMAILEGLKKTPEEAKKAQAEGEAFMKVLRRRVNTKYNLQYAGSVAKAFGVAAGAVSLAAPNPVTGGLVGATALASGVLFVVGKIALNKNPFEQAGDQWYQKLAAKIRVVVGNMTDAVERAALRLAQTRLARAAS